MKPTFLLLCAALLPWGAFSQKVFVDGQPLRVINGNTYTTEATISEDRFGQLELSLDGTRLFAHSVSSGDLVIFDPQTNEELDVVTSFSNVSDFAPGEDGFVFYSESISATIHKLDLSSKTVVETVNNSFGTQFTQRPGSDEIWIDYGEDIRIFTHSNMTLEDVTTGLSDDYEVYDICFSPDGATAYFFAKGFGVTAALYKMDAATRSVSLSTPISDYYGFTNHLSVSGDGATLYALFGGDANPNFKKLHVFSTNDLSLTDSATLGQLGYCAAEHPTRDELWVCYRGSDQVDVLDMNDGYSSIATIDVGWLPTNILITDIPAGVEEKSAVTSDWRVYPNPASEQLFLESSMHHAGASYELSDLNGRVLGSGQVQAGGVDISALAPGVYVVSIRAEDGAVRALVVRR